MPQINELTEERHTITFLSDF